jgi:hypothetical protein
MGIGRTNVTGSGPKSPMRRTRVRVTLSEFADPVANMRRAHNISK